MSQTLISHQPLDGVMNRLTNGNASRGVTGWSSEPSGAAVPSTTDSGISHFSTKVSPGGGLSSLPLHQPIYAIQVPKGHDLVNTFVADDLVSPTFDKNGTVIFRPSTYDAYFTDVGPSSTLSQVGVIEDGSAYPAYIDPSGGLIIRSDRVTAPDLVTHSLPDVWTKPGAIGTLSFLDPEVGGGFSFEITAPFTVTQEVNGEVFFRTTISAFFAGGGTDPLTLITERTPCWISVKRVAQIRTGEVVTATQFDGFFSERYRILKEVPSQTSKARARPEIGGVRSYASSEDWGAVTITRIDPVTHEITFPFLMSSLGRAAGFRNPLVGITSPLESGDGFLTPKYGARVSSAVETASTTVVTVIDADGFGKKKLGTLPLPSGTGTLNDWRMVPFVVTTAQWTANIANTQMTVAYRDFNGARTRFYVRFLDDYGRITAETGIAIPTDEEVEPGGITRKVGYLQILGDIPPGKAQLVITDDGSGPDEHQVGDAQLFRGFYGRDALIGDASVTVLRARDVPTASTQGEAGIVPPGTITLFTGGPTCPPGYREVVTGPGGEFDGLGGSAGHGAMRLGVHGPGSTLVAFVGKQRLTDVSTDRTNVLFNLDLTEGAPDKTFASDRNHLFSLPKGKRYPIPQLRAGMLLVAYPAAKSTRGQVEQSPMVWMIADLFGVDVGVSTVVPAGVIGPGPARRMLMSLVGDHEVEVLGAMEERREFVVIESSYLRYNSVAPGERTLGDDEHVHSAQSVTGITAEFNQYGGHTHGLELYQPLNHGHHRFGEPAAPIPYGRFFLFCQKL